MLPKKMRLPASGTESCVPNSFFPPDPLGTQILPVLMRVIPDEFAAYVADIINDLYSRAGKTVISVSAVALLWSASKGIAALMDGFNSMYQIRQENGFIKSRAIAIVYTFLFIILFAVVMSIYVTVST